MVDSKKSWKAWLYLSPAIILLLIFTVWPIINTVTISFRENYDIMKELGGNNSPWGLGNFKTVLLEGNNGWNDLNEFFEALKNTTLLCVITVPISTLLALLIAVCLNSIKPLQRLLQTIFFLPYVTNSIAIGMVFAAMFMMTGQSGPEDFASYGIINQALEAIFGVRINWMNSGSSYWANMFVMVVYIVWNALPFKILILLGGLQNINKQYYDAAKIDSTSRARVFTRITVPLLSPMLSYVIITSFIGGFKEYSSIVGVFGEQMGVPGDKWRLITVVGYIYKFINQNQGVASAAALVLFGIIFVVTMINLTVSKKTTHY